MDKPDKIIHLNEVKGLVYIIAKKMIDVHGAWFVMQDGKKVKIIK